MPAARAHRGRLVTLAVLGALITGVLLYRRRTMARHAAEFHERYG